MTRRVLIVRLALLCGLVLWMSYYFYFRTDGRGHVLREADSPAAAAQGQRLLGRADALLRQHQEGAAKALLDSLQGADANPAVFIEEDALRQRFDTLHAHQRQQHLTP